MESFVIFYNKETEYKFIPPIIRKSHMLSLAEKFGTHFSSISTSMPKLIQSETRNIINIPDSCTISISDVEFKLSKVRLNRSVGPDEVPNWILRDCAPLLAPH